MRSKRQTTEEERALFEATFADAKKPAKTKAAKKKSASASPSKKIVQPKPKIHSGIDGNTAERLRRGQLLPEAKLDLHGLTEAMAHRALATFLRSAQGRGLRFVIVVTGKGRPPPDDEPFDLELVARSRGVLATMVPRWLKEPGLARFVASVSSAHRKHGGGGALYVYLRKPK